MPNYKTESSNRSSTVHSIRDETFFSYAHTTNYNFSHVQLMEWSDITKLNNNSAECVLTDE